MNSVYKVRAPPGPLGILVESPKEGPFIHEIKKGSPVFLLVEKGDVLLSVDGVDCRSKEVGALAHWISTKPLLGEQVVTLMGNPAWGESEKSENDMSV